MNRSTKKTNYLGASALWLVLWSVASLTTAEQAIAQENQVPTCPSAIQPILICESLKSGFSNLPESERACIISPLTPSQTSTIADVSDDTTTLPVCLSAAEDNGRLLIGLFVGEKQPVVRVSVKTELSDGEQSEDDEVNDTPSDEGPVVEEPASFVFSARQSSESWMAFEDNLGRLSTSIVLDDIDDTLEVSLPLKSSHLLGPFELRTNVDEKQGSVVIEASEDAVLLNISIKQRSGLDRIELVVTNRFGEEAVLEISLNNKYFVVDRGLAEKSTSLALLYKLQADETYLRASSACSDWKDDPGCNAYIRAASLYDRAEENIPDCKDDETTTAESLPCRDEQLTRTWDLLRSDIAYRKKLLEYGLPFYGGFRSLTPTTPHQELIKMEALLDEMDELFTRIDTLQERYRQNQVYASLINAEKAYALGQSDANQIDRRIGEISTDFATLDVDTFTDRQQQLESEIGQFQQKLNDLSAQQEQLGKQATALTQAGIAAATGIPVSDAKALASGDLESVAKSFVQSQILDENAPLAKDFAASSEIARGIVDAVGEVREAVDQFEGIKEQAELVQSAFEGDRDAIRSLVSEYGSEDVQNLLAEAEELEGRVEQAIALTKSLDRKRAIAFLRSQLSDEQNAEIDRIVEAVKPIEFVFEAAYVGLMEGDFEDALLEEFEAQLTEILKEVKPSRNEIRRMRAELKALIQQDPALFDNQYFARQVIASIDTISSRSKEIVSAVLTFDPNLILEIPEIDQFMRRRLNAAQRREVQTALRDLTTRSSDYVSVVGDRICISAPRQSSCIDFADIRRLFKAKYNEATKFPVDQINQFFNAQIDELPDEGVVLLYLAKDGAAGFSGNLRGLFGNDDEKLGKAWRRLKFDGNLFSLPAVRDSGRVAVAGLLTAAELPTPDPVKPLPAPQPNPNGPPPSAPQPLDPTEGGPDPVTNAAMTAALNYALPGAGIALQLGQTWASMDANRELQEDYMQSLSAAIREQDQLARSKQLATRRAALAGLQKERAVALQRAGEQQIAQFEVALAANMDEAKFNRELLSLYRPRFYYISESLRERFEAFDRSLADWSSGVPQSGFFKDKILEDPRNARLALDNEIQLFGWLNRNIESTRTGPYVLHNHWKRLVGLARNYCADSGCKPGDGALGQIGQTVPQRFFEDIQGRNAQRAFFAWRDAEDRSEKFEMAFSFGTGQLGLPANSQNARLLDFVIVPIDEKGRPLEGSRVELQHDGISTLVLPDPEFENGTPTRQVRHVLLPRQLLAPNRKQSEDVEILRRRFQDQVSVQSLLRLRDVEGYGLYGNFHMSVLNGPQIEDVHDFRIQLSYIYTNPVNINSEADFVAQLERGACRQDIEPGKTLTGTFCHSDGRAVYRAIEVKQDETLGCSSRVLADVRLQDESHADFFRALGELQCLRIIADPEDKDPQEPDLIVDLPLTLEKKGCSEDEALLLAASGSTTATCFGEKK